jgi:protein-S-isoprenylcysteine O-methyltransferase Ste14
LRGEEEVMDEELLFRLVFWLQLAIIFLFNRVLPALHARKKGERILPDAEAIKNEGRFLFALRFIVGLPLAVYIVCYSIDPPFMVHLRVGIPSWLRWSGALVATIGVAFWVYSQAVLDRNWSPQLQIQDGHELMKKGPYAVMRHPLYTGMIVWVLGLALFTANVGFMVFAFLSVVLLAARVPREEKMMKDRFGEEYRVYQAETGGFVPRLRKKRKEL